MSAYATLSRKIHGEICSTKMILLSSVSCTD